MRGVLALFISLKILVESINGENLYLEILFLSVSENILNYPLEALKPQSPLFFTRVKELSEEIILLLAAIINF